MKIGILGTGNWGRNIVQNLVDLGCETFCFDPSETNRDLLSKRVSTKFLNSAEEVVEQADAVCIATPPHTHFELAVSCLERSKPIFVEKPVTATFEEAWRLAELVETRKCPAMVGHLLVYQSAVQFLRQVIEEKRFGNLVSIHQTRLNLGQARGKENVLESLGVHDIAVLTYLTGQEPRLLNVSGQAFLSPTVEDDVHLALIFPGDIKAYLHVSWLWPVRERKTVTVFEHGMIVYDELDQSVRHYRKRINSELKAIDEGEEVIFKGDQSPLKTELEHFIECVQTGTPPLTSVRRALPVMKVLQDAREELSRQQLCERGQK